MENEDRLPFIQELMETRMFRNAEVLKGKHPQDLAKLLYTMFMALEILKNVDFRYAKDYAGRTFAYSNWDYMRTNVTDMANIIAVLMHPERYSSKIKPDSKITIPEFQTKTYFRNSMGDGPHPEHKRYFFTLEGYLNITETKYKTLRRFILDWENTELSDQEWAVKQVVFEFNHLGRTCDLFLDFVPKVKNYEF